MKWGNFTLPQKLSGFTALTMWPGDREVVSAPRGVEIELKTADGESMKSWVLLIPFTLDRQYDQEAAEELAAKWNEFMENQWEEPEEEVA